MMHRILGSRRCWLPGIFMLLILLSGCATQTRALLARTHPELPSQLELKATPFFPQELYQCGPAALAASLRAAGIPVEPETLVAQVYLPQREGSLQLEMLAAGRRNGALSLTIPARLDALLAELAGGNPVLVLQNLSLRWIPVWHYAVAIGYDLARGEIILRSGTTERLVLPMSTFEHTWARSGYWGMVTLAPGKLPATAEEATMLDALVAFEKNGNAADAHKAYAAAAQRWPGNLTLLLGLGNTAYGAGNRVAAADAFRRAGRQHPDSAPAFNNLAVVLSELGQLDDARAAAETALALGGPWRAAALATLESIQAAKQRKIP
ncbi:MAG: PA2778 family cysteine peptidase [Oxalobacteraceae bacterium]|nr:PA2778 family cysteine peptidase [Oxalobacteraceae bacterium]